jgi:hypothetical protein
MTTALWFFLLLFAPQAPTASISGLVSLEDGGQAVAGEAIGLWPSGKTTRTDGQGKFTFSNVAAGQHSVIVIRDRVKHLVPVAVASGQKLDGVSVVLKSPPAITGTVFDPFGERLAAARVQAFRMVYRLTGPAVRSVLSVMTNDLGEYRLPRLPAGEYYISASYSDRDQRADSGFRFSPNLTKADDGYPTLYIGGATSAAQSQKTLLSQADAFENNIYLRQGERYSVNGRLVRAEGDACGQIALVPQGAFLDPDKDFSLSACGAFTFKGLSPGPYVLIAIGQGIASDVFSVYIGTKNVDGVRLFMERTVTLRGRVSLDISPSANRRVVLSRSSSELTQRFEAMTFGNGAFEIENVGPGFFDAFVEPLPEGAYIRSIRQGVNEGLSRSSTLRGNFGDLDIQLSSRGAKAEGTAVDPQGRPVPGAQVVLVPTTYRNREDRYYPTFADAGGNFKVTGIAPGSYVAFSFEDIEPGMYFAFGYDLNLLNRWQQRGQRLEFSEGGESKELKVTTVPATETSGGLR